MLYEKDVVSRSYPIFTDDDFMLAFKHLQLEKGNCTTTFVNHGDKIELCAIVKAFTSKLEVVAILAVQSNPQIQELDWAESLYATKDKFFEEVRHVEMFRNMAKVHFYELLQSIIGCNPTSCKGVRTFDEFVIALCPGTIRIEPKEEEEIEGEEDTPPVKKTRRRKRKSA